MSPKLIERITLPNGLVLELLDQSRVMAGDRWLVSLLARIEVPISPEYFITMGHSEQAYRDLVSAYGDPLVFTQEKVRYFVDKKDYQEVLTGICQRLKDTLVPYLGNPKFASQFVLKKYGDLQDRQDWVARDP
jgi:hypothetical protein